MTGSSTPNRRHGDDLVVEAPRGPGAPARRTRGGTVRRRNEAGADGPAALASPRLRIGALGSPVPAAGVLAALFAVTAPAPSHSETPPSLPGAAGVDSLLTRPMPEDLPVLVETLVRTEEVGVQFVRIRTAVAAHRHARHAETGFLLEGTGVFLIDGTRFEATAGDVFVVPPGTPHAFRTKSDEPVAAATTARLRRKDRVWIEDAPEAGGEN